MHKVGDKFKVGNQTFVIVRKVREFWDVTWRNGTEGYIGLEDLPDWVERGVATKINDFKDYLKEAELCINKE